MMSEALYLPRIILVTRKTPLTLLLEQHGTLAQAHFYLASRGQDIAGYEQAHEQFQAALAQVLASIPPDRRRARLDRDDLDRFLFAPDDIVLVVGQDGLVPNVAKYLHGQITIGINSDPARYDGVLCQHPPQATAALLTWTAHRDASGYCLQRRVMAVAEREDGQRLLALNEVFVGHQSHQSARYRLVVEGREERQSSSGVICATGTGSTGWVRSIVEQRDLELTLPRPEEPRLAWFVREPFPSVYTGTNLDWGLLEPDHALVIRSEMGRGGVIFADGIETDHVEFLDGHTVRIGVTPEALNLVVPDIKSNAR